MAKILVSLIGDQTAPNLFLIRDPYFREVDQHLFITTEVMEERNKVQQLVAALDIGEEKYQKVVVNPDDLSALTASLDHLHLENGQHQYLVNLSSGNKIMSVGIFNYFTQAPLSHYSQIYYVPIRESSFLRIWPGPNKSMPMTHDVGLVEYLRSYGVEIEQLAYQEGLTLPKAYSDQIMAQCYDKNFWNKHFEPFTKQIRILHNADRGQPIALKEQDDLKDFLKSIRFPQKYPDQLTVKESIYLIGGWLEEWVFHKIGEHLTLQERAIAFQVKINNRQLKGIDVPNEFDVMFLHKNAFFVLECKTSLDTRQRATKKKLEDALYRLAALRKSFGMNVHTAFITFSDQIGNQAGWKKKQYAKRAAILDIALIDRYDLAMPTADWVAKLMPQSLIKPD